MTTTTDKIINDDRQRSLKILRDAGLRGWSYAIMHPSSTRRTLKAATTVHLLTGD